MKLLLCLIFGIILTTEAANPRCNACVAVLTQLKQLWVLSGSNLDQTSTLLTSYCSTIPQNYVEICTYLQSSVLTSVIKQIEELQSNDLTPICESFGMCIPKDLSIGAQQQQQQQQQQKRNKEDQNAVKCSACVLIVDLLESFIVDETTDQQIIKELDRLCEKLFFQTGACEEIVEYGVENLVALLRGKATPDYICKLIKLCTN